MADVGGRRPAAERREAGGAPPTSQTARVAIEGRLKQRTGRDDVRHARNNEGRLVARP